MVTPGLPSIEDVIEIPASPGARLAAVYASGWVVRHTLVPAWARDMLALALVLAPVAGVVLWARHAGVSLERERCRARTSDGRRCRRAAESADAEVCWQHAELSDVELVDVDETDRRKRI